MTLLEKQNHFTYLVAKLIQWAYGHGYRLSFGEAFRTQEQALLNSKTGMGIRNSLHCQRLAVDLNLFKDGEFLHSSEAHRPLGEYWESLDDACRWGGRFKKPDGNHYSYEHEGRA
jgi:hypothetical protein